MSQKNGPEPSGTFRDPVQYHHTPPAATAVVMGNRLGSFGTEPSGITSAEYYNLAADVRASIVLVDCRPKEEYDRAHLDGAVHAASDCAAEVRDHPRVEQWEVIPAHHRSCRAYL